MLALLSLPVLWAPGVAPAMDVWGRYIDPAQSYLAVNTNVLLLYGRMPLSVLGAITLLLAPGLLLSLALGARSVWSWVVHGFALSLVVVSAVAAVVQGALGEPLIGFGFVATVAACAVAAGVVLQLRLRSGAVAAWPVAPGSGLRTLAVLAVVPLLFTVLLTPKIFWESFNGDGAHAYEATRLLLWQALPFWPADIGEELASFPGIKTLLFAYPNSWFLRLFGEYEASVRLPLVLYLPVLFSAVCAMASAVKSGLGRVEQALIWAGVVGFAAVMSYSATYNPYCADVGLPATQDALLLICFLGAVHSFVCAQRRWMALFVLFSLTTSPNGLLMLGAWGVGVALAYRTRPWRQLMSFAGIMLGCLVALWLAPDVLRSLGLPGPGHEHSTGGLLRKLRYLAPFDFSRLAFLVVPAGIYPICGILGWRRANDATRAMWVVVALVFGLFYFMAFVSLHYFVPAMLLPLAAFWMHHRVAAWRSRGATAACVVCAAVALFLATPQSTGIYIQSRRVGEQIEFRGMPDYHTMESGWAASIGLLGARSGAELDTGLFPRDGDVTVPEPHYGGSPLAWGYYARRPSRPETDASYVVAAPGVESPFGNEPMVRQPAASLYVRDPEQRQQQLAARPLGSVGRSIYSVPRDVMFRRPEAVVDHMWVIDLREWRNALLGDGK